MPKIIEEIVINCSVEKAFDEMMTLEFMKKIDPVAFGNKTEILFQNERLLRFLSKGAPSGDIEMERVTIPESFTIVTHRRPPLAPFLYQLSIKILSEHKGGTLIKQINEFELDENNKPKEGVLISIIRKNDIHNLQETKNYFSKGYAGRASELMGRRRSLASTAAATQLRYWAVFRENTHPVKKD